MVGDDERPQFALEVGQRLGVGVDVAAVILAVEPGRRAALGVVVGQDRQVQPLGPRLAEQLEQAERAGQAEPEPVGVGDREAAERVRVLVDRAGDFRQVEDRHAERPQRVVVGDERGLRLLSADVRVGQGHLVLADVDFVGLDAVRRQRERAGAQLDVLAAVLAGGELPQSLGADRDRDLRLRLAGPEDGVGQHGLVGGEVVVDALRRQPLLGPRFQLGRVVDADVAFEVGPGHLLADRSGGAEAAEAAGLLAGEEDAPLGLELDEVAVLAGLEERDGPGQLEGERVVGGGDGLDVIGVEPDRPAARPCRGRGGVFGPAPAPVFKSSPDSTPASPPSPPLPAWGVGSRGAAGASPWGGAVNCRPVGLRGRRRPGRRRAGPTPRGRSACRSRHGRGVRRR